MPVTQAPLSYDPFAEEVVADPYPWYRRLQDEAPVYRQDELDFWVLSRYDDVLAGARAHAALSSSEGVVYTRAPLPMMLTMDPPDHTRLRRMVSRDFTPTAVSQWRPLVEGLAAQAVDRMLEAGTVDAVEMVTAPLPMQVIADVIGVPAADYPQFKAWSDQIVVGLAITSPTDTAKADVMIDGILAMQEYTKGLVAERRERPRDDMLTKLVQPREDGGLLHDGEVFWFLLLLLVAGNETTTNLLGNILLTLAEEPAHWARLQAEPGLVPSAVEESLRRDAPIQGFFRTVVEPYVVHDVEIPARDRVLLLWGAANRDPRHYDDPDTFRIERNPSDHLGFGSGIHLCLGAHLARLETTAVLDQLLRRAQHVELAGQPARGTNPILRGMAHLPLRLTPA
jgi:beta-dihydromenaquinone-9 omega-hydroxylase